MRSRIAGLALMASIVATPVPSRAADAAWRDADTAGRIHDLVVATPSLKAQRSDLPLPPELAKKMGMISWMAASAGGDSIYLLQRGPELDPIIEIDREGHVLRSWGRGLFRIPHSIRLDKEGNIWTVDSGSSLVQKFSPTGEKLIEIPVGEIPAGKGFLGTTDIAFGPDGRIYISDGYGNARVLMYSPEGKRLGQWGEHGTGPGQFNVPHAIVVGPDGVVYVADRENGRIQRFDLDGRYLGEWRGLGKPMTLELQADGSLLVGTGYRNKPGESPDWLAWILRIDTHSGKLAGVLEVGDDAHALETLAAGDILTGGEADGVTAVHRFRLER